MAASQVGEQEGTKDKGMSDFFRFPSTPRLFSAAGAKLPRDDKLMSAQALRELLAEEVTVEEKLAVAVVPCLFRGRVTCARLEAFLESQPSHYRDGPMEGVVVRSDDGVWLRARGKLVRADFSQTLEEHWRSRAIEWNRIKF